MSRRTNIVKALSAKLNTITKANGYRTDLYENAHPTLKFWDAIEQFPAIYMSPGTEYREYHPGAFAWGLLGVSIKVYCKGEYAQDELEDLLEDVEKCISANNALVYDDTSMDETTEILIQMITTDEGLLAPYAVGEINIQVRYQIMVLS